jgi:hypothetical protein
MENWIFYVAFWLASDRELLTASPTIQGGAPSTSNGGSKLKLKLTNKQRQTKLLQLEQT